jgi:uncharacterized protein YndB with AHSA1/START domain
MTAAPPSSSPLGQIKVEGESATLVFERHFHHPVDAVWNAITDADELSEWYFSRGRIEPRLGGKVEFSLGPAHVTGSVLVWDPPRVFEHEWIVDRADRPVIPQGDFGIIRWELDSIGDETILRLTHRKLPGALARNLIVGVHVRLDRLDAFLDQRSQLFWKTHVDDVQARYADH